MEKKSQTNKQFLVQYECVSVFLLPVKNVKKKLKSLWEKRQLGEAKNIHREWEKVSLTYSGLNNNFFFPINSFFCTDLCY